MKKLLLILFTLIISLSYGQETKSQRFSTNKRLLNKLLKKNGNAFEIVASGNVVSYIWTYSATSIDIYSLIKGKKTSLNSYIQDNKNIKWLIQKDFKQYKLRDCQILDGSIFIINIIHKEENNKLIEKEYPVDWGCLKTTEFTSEFYKNLSLDIKKYKIGWE
ncbi:hypothetical protein [Chryseobacterium sp. ERMR1:04]|uniref:hypothetical protein n=1 Tax=Chryseobacterium sp. ERMR1:04 TaxID=1705393 RepID=UPI0006C8BBB1|nr:hypothetical protein [Chryseobacterium sp. ERMR1:04]KPH14981.1 hypothetical protein AMQ68_06115 [Chryseobacterium sp. ERMR1:04]